MKADVVGTRVGKCGGQGVEFPLHRATFALGVRGQGKPLQLVLGGAEYDELAEWRDRIMARIQAENPRIVSLESD